MFKISTAERDAGTALFREQPHSDLRHQRQSPGASGRQLRALGVRRRSSGRAGTDDSTELRGAEKGRRSRIRVDSIQDERQRDHELAGRTVVADEVAAVGRSDELVPDFDGGGAAAEVRAPGAEGAEPGEVVAAGKKRLNE